MSTTRKDQADTHRSPVVVPAEVAAAGGGSFSSLDDETSQWEAVLAASLSALLLPASSDAPASAPEADGAEGTSEAPGSRSHAGAADVVLDGRVKLRRLSLVSPSACAEPRRLPLPSLMSHLLSAGLRRCRPTAEIESCEQGGAAPEPEHPPKRARVSTPPPPVPPNAARCARIARCALQERASAAVALAHVDPRPLSLGHLLVAPRSRWSDCRAPAVPSTSLSSSFADRASLRRFLVGRLVYAVDEGAAAAGPSWGLESGGARLAALLVGVGRPGGGQVNALAAGSLVMFPTWQLVVEPGGGRYVELDAFGAVVLEARESAAEAQAPRAVRPDELDGAGRESRDGIAVVGRALAVGPLWNLERAHFVVQLASAATDVCVTVVMRGGTASKWYPFVVPGRSYLVTGLARVRVGADGGARALVSPSGQCAAEVRELGTDEERRVLGGAEVVTVTASRPPRSGVAAAAPASDASDAGGSLGRASSVVPARGPGMPKGLVDYEGAVTDVLDEWLLELDGQFLLMLDHCPLSAFPRCGRGRRGIYRGVRVMVRSAHAVVCGGALIGLALCGRSHLSVLRISRIGSSGLCGGTAAELVRSLRELAGSSVRERAYLFRSALRVRELVGPSRWQELQTAGQLRAVVEFARASPTPQCTAGGAVQHQRQQGRRQQQRQDQRQRLLRGDEDGDHVEGTMADPCAAFLAEHEWRCLAAPVLSCPENNGDKCSGGDEDSSNSSSSSNNNSNNVDGSERRTFPEAVSVKELLRLPAVGSAWQELESRWFARGSGGASERSPSVDLLLHSHLLGSGRERPLTLVGTLRAGVSAGSWRLVDSSGWLEAAPTDRRPRANELGRTLLVRHFAVLIDWQGAGAGNGAVVAFELDQAVPLSPSDAAPAEVSQPSSARSLFVVVTERSSRLPGPACASRSGLPSSVCWDNARSGFCFFVRGVGWLSPPDGASAEPEPGRCLPEPAGRPVVLWLFAPASALYFCAEVGSGALVRLGDHAADCLARQWGAAAAAGPAELAACDVESVAWDAERPSWVPPGTADEARRAAMAAFVGVTDLLCAGAEGPALPSDPRPCCLEGVVVSRELRSRLGGASAAAAAEDGSVAAAPGPAAVAVDQAAAGALREVWQIRGRHIPAPATHGRQHAQEQHQQQQHQQDACQQWQVRLRDCSRSDIVDVYLTWSRAWGPPVLLPGSVLRLSGCTRRTAKKRGTYFVSSPSSASWDIGPCVPLPASPSRAVGRGPPLALGFPSSRSLQLVSQAVCPVSLALPAVGCREAEAELASWVPVPRCLLLRPPSRPWPVGALDPRGAADALAGLVAADAAGTSRAPAVLLASLHARPLCPDLVQDACRDQRLLRVRGAVVSLASASFLYRCSVCFSPATGRGAAASRGEPGLSSGQGCAFYGGPVPTCASAGCGASSAGAEATFCVEVGAVLDDGTGQVELLAEGLPAVDLLGFTRAEVARVAGLARLHGQGRLRYVRQQHQPLASQSSVGIGPGGFGPGVASSSSSSFASAEHQADADAHLEAMDLFRRLHAYDLQPTQVVVLCRRQVPWQTRTAAQQRQQQQQDAAAQAACDGGRASDIDALLLTDGTNNVDEAPRGRFGGGDDARVEPVPGTALRNISVCGVQRQTLGGPRVALRAERVQRVDPTAEAWRMLRGEFGS